MLVQADKDKTTVVIHKDEYAGKTHAFLSDNDIHILQKKPMNKDCKKIHETLQ
jgi:hypothetical protein